MGLTLKIVKERMDHL